MANLLLEREVIFRDDLENIFGKRKYKDAHSAEEDDEEKALAAINNKPTENNTPEVV